MAIQTYPTFSTKSKSIGTGIVRHYTQTGISIQS
ncbi:hypothetical protein PM8797T_29653 [Gimesia maris DSM 8797]|nr:hypothetical protein PM8797T_29653 [Gimesia maris DSM 8797]